MIIYKILNLVNGKIYIGQTTQILRKRIDNHIADSKRNRVCRVASKISRAIAKYGKDSFEFSVICTTQNLDELNRLESFYIDLYDSTNDTVGYNLLSGGRQSGKHSDESKRKISESALVASNRAKKNGSHWNTGRMPTAEKTLKVSNSLRSESNPNAMPVIQLTKEGVFIARYHSQAHAARSIGGDHGNISSCCTGKLKTAYGFKWTYEQSEN